jgi:hypothetical protein
VGCGIRGLRWHLCFQTVESTEILTLARAVAEDFETGFQSFSIEKHQSPFIGKVLTGINIELFLLIVSMMPSSGKVYCTGLTKS